MEKRYKRKEQIYHSKKILGQLYDRVKLVQFVPSLDMPFDCRILNCSLLPFSEQFMEFARELKKEYDSDMRRVMAQYEIKTEFEVWSTFVLNHGNAYKDYKLHEDLGRIMDILRSGFRQKCYDKVGGRMFDTLAPLVVAMYRITQEEVEATLELRQAELFLNPDPLDDNDNLNTSADSPPLISFPWMFSDFLGKIALGRFKAPDPEKNQYGRPPSEQAAIFTHNEVVVMLRDPEAPEKSTLSSVEKDAQFDDAGSDSEEDIFEDAIEAGVPLDSGEEDSEEDEDIVEKEGDVKSWVMDNLLRLGS